MLVTHCIRISKDLLVASIRAKSHVSSQLHHFKVNWIELNWTLKFLLKSTNCCWLLSWWWLWSFQIQFPGVKESTFRQLLHYLYTDRIPPMQALSCVSLIELANRLCLPRLVQLVESHIVNEMQRTISSGGEVTMECLTLIEPCQVFSFYFIKFIVEKIAVVSIFR